MARALFLFGILRFASASDFSFEYTCDVSDTAAPVTFEWGVGADRLALAAALGAGCTGCAGLGCAVDEAECFTRVALTHVLKTEELAHAEAPPLPALHLCDASATAAAKAAEAAESDEAAHTDAADAGTADGEAAEAAAPAAKRVAPLSGPEAAAAERAQATALARKPEEELPELSADEMALENQRAAAAFSARLDKEHEAWLKASTSPSAQAGRSPAADATADAAMSNTGGADDADAAGGPEGTSRAAARAAPAAPSSEAAAAEAAAVRAAAEAGAEAAEAKYKAAEAAAAAEAQENAALAQAAADENAELAQTAAAGDAPLPDAE